MRFFARILPILLTAVLLTNFFSTSVFAAENADNTSFTMPQTEQGVPRDVHTLSQSVILGMISFITCALSGIDIVTADHRCLGYNGTTGKLGYVDNSIGITGMLTNGIAMTFTKPMGTSDYLQYLGSNFGIVKHAYAANDGFAQLSPLLSIWVGMRNVAYVLFVLIFIITGFAIMLRAKIDPRTAMTIENQIPKLIIALLLISFSFAIAGLMVDVMWVLIYVTVNLFVSLDPKGLGGQLGSITNGVSGNPFDMANSVSNAGGFLNIAGQAAGGVRDVANAAFKAFFATDVGNVIKWILLIFDGIPILLSCAISQVTQNIPVIGWFTGSKDFGTCVSDGMGSIIATFGGIIAFCIFTIALIVVLAKLWWQLIKSYSLFVIYVIFAPLFIMMGALPGSKINFDNWIRHIAAYLFVFPTAIGILLLGKVVMDAYGNGNNGLVPPLLGINPAASQALGPLLGFAIIMLLPQSLTIVQDALQAPDMKYLPGIGGMLAAGTTATTTMINKPWQRLTRKENKMEGLDEGPLRKLMLGGAGGWRRRLLGDTTGK